MSSNDEKSKQNHIPDWKIERFLLGELDDSEMKLIRRAVESDERLRARLDEIERSNEKILRAYPPGWMNRQIREKLGGEVLSRRAGRRKHRFRTIRVPLAPAAVLAVVALAIVVLPYLLSNGDFPGTEVTRLKGSTPQLRLHRKTASGSEQLRDGDRATQNDRILLQYHTDQAGYGAILSVDGRGTITRHLPAEGDEAVALESGRAQLLDYSYELDDAPHWEVFVFVTSSTAFRIDRIVATIEESLSLSSFDSASDSYTIPPDSLDFPEGYRYATFTLIKDSDHAD
jgi:hypothetical protein